MQSTPLAMLTALHVAPGPLRGLTGFDRGPLRAPMKGSGRGTPRQYNHAGGASNKELLQRIGQF
jgi:hypothetical protein